MCWSFYYGERCENGVFLIKPLFCTIECLVRYVQSSATEPPYPPLSTLKPPTTPPNNDKASFMLNYSVSVLVSIFILCMRVI